MTAVEFIRMGMEFSDRTLGLIDDMKDRPLTFPTTNGGNHPLWILGHMAYSQGAMLHRIDGRPIPLAHWKDLFGPGTEPTADASKYPSYDEVRKAWTDVRAEAYRFLDTLTDADLDKPCANCPPELKKFIGTYGQALMLFILHPTAHRGQVADARRSAGRKVMAM
jgi:uncharacterized damage-inducible protein DinB